ncbi:MAG: DUF433 domain-containing protein [Candidatus Gottesmanbacteria bacterium]|nr:DUF433 domain-containing protein [Candidatus Gottesmanbacteria bacterium]
MKRTITISIDPHICHGKPVIAGTRVMVWQIPELLESGSTAGEVYSAYPTVPKGAVEVALHYAAERVKSIEYVPFSPQPQPYVFA